MKGRVLVVDDDAALAEMLGIVLRGEGFEPTFVADGDKAIEVFRDSRPDLVLLDLMLPGSDGIDVCRQIRAESGVPIVMLTAKTDTVDVVLGLESGADDYIVKPFTAEKVVARLRLALRRRLGLFDVSPLGVGEFKIDFDDRRVSVHGQPVRLTPKEFDLFVFMARHPNRVLPHKTLLEAVWGKAFEAQSEYLRVFVGQLRRKLELDPSNPRYFVTEPWVGYRFNPTGPPQ